MHMLSNVLTSDVDVLVFCIDGSSEEAAESVNPREQELSASEFSESNVPNEPTEALLRISQDMARVLDRLTAPKAPIDTVRRHG